MYKKRFLSTASSIDGGRVWDIKSNSAVPEHRSFERKLLVGTFGGYKEKADQLGQKIPGYSGPR